MQQGNFLKLAAPIERHCSQIVVDDVQESRQTAPDTSLQRKQQLVSSKLMHAVIMQNMPSRSAQAFSFSAALV